MSATSFRPMDATGPTATMDSKLPTAAWTALRPVHSPLENAARFPQRPQGAPHEINSPTEDLP